MHFQLSAKLALLNGRYSVLPAIIPAVSFHTFDPACIVIILLQNRRHRERSSQEVNRGLREMVTTTSCRRLRRDKPLIDTIATVASVGITILKHGFQIGRSLEEMLEDILRMGDLHSWGNDDAQNFSFELAYLSDSNVLKSIVSIRNSLLSEIGLNATREVVEFSDRCLGIGPIAANAESVEPVFRRMLAERGIQEIQFDVIQPIPGHQAVLLTGNRCSHLDLGSPAIQANIRTIRSLLELAMVILIREPGNGIDICQHPTLRSVQSPKTQG